LTDFNWPKSETRLTLHLGGLTSALASLCLAFFTKKDCTQFPSASQFISLSVCLSHSTGNYTVFEFARNIFYSGGTG